MSLLEHPVDQAVLFSERLLAAAAVSPTRVALKDDDSRLTYSELISMAARIGGAFRRDGVNAGDTIAICATNSVTYGVVYVAAAIAGVVTAPLPQSATAESIAAMAGDCGAKLIFADADNAERLATHCGNLIPLSDITGWVGVTEPAEPARVAPQARFNIIYSSGTTGAPKGIVQSHAMRAAHVRLAQSCGYDGNAVTLISTPLYSNTTLISFLPTLALGGTVILMRKFDVEGFLQRAQNERVTHAILVPVQYQRLMASPRFDSVDLSSFKQKYCTSAPFAPELKREVLRRWPGGLTEYYGMTEGGGLCILFAHEHPDKLHTVGQPASDNDIRLIDDDGRELPRGEIGEVVGHSANMMQGYHMRPEETASAYWYSAEGKRFMRTGDIGRFDDDGFLQLLDRKKDVIISGGFNIFPSDIEDVLCAHPDVAEAAVVGVASEAWGETPVAYVVLKSGAAKSDLLSFTNARLGKSQRLTDLRIIEQLPRNAIGKVLKRELRDSYQPLS